MIFPRLRNRRFGYLNLNEWAKQHLGAEALNEVNARSPFLDPTQCTLLVSSYHTMLNLIWSYGGWMEDRRFVWKGSYLEEEAKFLHLGVDLNVPPGEPVALDEKARVVRIDNDAPEEHGWGNRVIFALESEPIVLIYAHLGPKILCELDEVVDPGEVFAQVGTPKENGGWYPHLHIQAVSSMYYEQLLENNLRDLDGYGNAEQIQFLSSNFPDPLKYIRCR